MTDNQHIRMTRQRKVILEELCKVCNHPTADQVYEMVRKRLPHISLATVYRNLEILSGIGSIMKLEFAGAQRRYDGNAAPHYHARCQGCDKVVDAHMPPIDVPQVPESLNGFFITGHQFEFTGYCEDCRKAMADSEKSRDSFHKTGASLPH